MKTKIFTLLFFIFSVHYSYEQANRTLSNLQPTAVNQSLLPGADNSIDLGSPSNSWKNFYFKGAIFKGANRFIYSPNITSTYIGIKAGNSITTGYANTGIGDSALYSNTEGLYNTATGYLSLRYNQADYNTANGSFALSSNVSGAYNTAVGSQALNSNSNGNFNTAYGYQSLYSNTTGTNNTAIGAFTDVSTNNLTNTTVIGAHATVTQSNSLILGGTGSYAVNVGIGTASPAEKLHIGGVNPGIQLGSSLIKQSGANLLINAPLGSSFPPPGNLILQTSSGRLFSGNIGIGTSTPLQKLHVFGASIIANNTTINPSTTANTVIAGAIKDGSGWSVTSGIGGKASGAGQEWGIGAIGNSLYFGFGNGTTDDSIQTGIQILGNRNVLLVPGGSGNVGIGTNSPKQKLHIVGASILANNTTINPSTTANTVIAGAIHDGSGWAVTSGIGGKANGAGQEWGIGSINGALFFGTGNATADNTMQSGIQINPNRDVLLVPGGSGNVGIGANSPVYKLDVCGTIRAKEVLVQTGWCDYVFNKDYKLRSLSEVESYIDANKHLPDVPSATEVEDKGVKVAQMDSILIKKVEELTLYIIDQNKQIQELQNKVIQLEKGNADNKNQ